jgi:TRAP-type mannitol/chloroaromatic compound transport system substrate-binding protein
LTDPAARGVAAAALTPERDLADPSPDTVVGAPVRMCARRAHNLFAHGATASSRRRAEMPGLPMGRLRLDSARQLQGGAAMSERASAAFRIASIVYVLIMLGGCEQRDAERAAVSATPSQPSIALKIQASWPAGQTLYENLQMFATRVDQMSAGRLKIETLPDGSVVPALEVLNAVHRGVIDGGHTAPGYWIGKHVAAIPLSHGPLFGMDYVDFFGWYYEGGGVELLNEWYSDVLKMNVISIPILPSGPQALGWFKKPIRSWDDFKGVKFRIYGLGAEVFKDAGMSVVTLPGGEILPAGERGVIDGAEWVGGVEDLRFGFYNIWKYHYTPGMHEPVTVGDLLINKDAWNKLSPDLQEIVRAAATETFWRWWVRWQRQNADAYKELVEKHGVQVARTPDDILMTFLRGWDKFAREQAQQDAFFKKVLDSQRAYAAQVVPYRRSTWPKYEYVSDHYWKDQIYGK